MATRWHSTTRKPTRKALHPLPLCPLLPPPLPLLPSILPSPSSFTLPAELLTSLDVPCPSVAIPSLPQLRRRARPGRHAFVADPQSPHPCRQSKHR